MKLSRYMAERGITDAQMAALLGKGRTAVLRYRHGEVTPPVDVIAKLQIITNNEVSFADFVKLE